MSANYEEQIEAIIHKTYKHDAQKYYLEKIAATQPETPTSLFVGLGLIAWQLAQVSEGGHNAKQ